MASGVETATVDHKDGSGTRLAYERHTFEGSPAASFWIQPNAYPPWKESRETLSENLDTNGTSLMRSQAMTWAQGGTVSWWTGGPATSPPVNPRLTQRGPKTAMKAQTPPARPSETGSVSLWRTPKRLQKDWSKVPRSGSGWKRPSSGSERRGREALELLSAMPTQPADCRTWLRQTEGKSPSIYKLSKSYQLNTKEAEALDASIAAHEGEHIRKILGVGVPLKGEKATLFVASAVCQGLSTTDTLTQLWDESWARIDQQTREINREEVIQAELKRQRDLRNGKEEQQ